MIEVMRFRKKQNVILCLLGVVLLTTIVLIGHFNDLENTANLNFVWKATFPTLEYFEKSKSDQRVYLQDLGVTGKRDISTTCQFPRLSLYNDANKDKFETLDPLVCSYGKDLFNLENGIVKLNKTVLKTSTDNAKIEKCEYLAIERVHDDYFTYTEPVVKEKHPFDMIIQHDFIQVKCNLFNPEEEAAKIRVNKTTARTSSDLSEVTDIEEWYRQDSPFLYQEDGMGKEENFDFDQFIVQIYPKPEVLKRKSSVPSDPGTGLNVLIIGLDSLSHLSFQRLLPLTYNFFRDELDFTILNGYNILGDGTTANVIPLLTGKTEMELPEVRKHMFESGYVDKYPFIWKEFEKHGYATVYAEDEPSIGTFNLRLNGFDKPPTDHYMRPFWQAVWQSTLREISPRYCTGHTPHHHYLLGYVKDFFIKYKSMPKFAFLFMAELTHWKNDPGQHLDSDLKKFFQWFKHSGELEKTVVIVMADHGARYGKVRSTVQGKIEERMPMMSIRYPIEFLEKHPMLLKNLKLNKDRLVTPFDIYETVADVLDKSRFSPSSPKKSHRISLSQEISFNRTCKDAHIDTHWCSCLSRLQQHIDNEYVKKIADKLVAYINRLTLPVRKHCRKLELKEIKSAYLMIPNEKVLKFLREKDQDYRYANFSKQALLDIAHYEVTIETNPQNGLFEATAVVNFEEGSVKLNPDISRLDLYGQQPLCVQKRYPDLRKFCLCKNFKLSEGI
ncbi:uncharacterized protein LOC134712542 [Mytilus trossulus]|uniref:uncharacterized protein LOC134712542 n=1 Tax=Mytilus trossulus TaxID=6551 RepID=UPI003005D804